MQKTYHSLDSVEYYDFLYETENDGKLISKTEIPTINESGDLYDILYLQKSHKIVELRLNKNEDWMAVYYSLQYK